MVLLLPSGGGEGLKARTRIRSSLNTSEGVSQTTIANSEFPPPQANNHTFLSRHPLPLRLRCEHHRRTTGASRYVGAFPFPAVTILPGLTRSTRAPCLSSVGHLPTATGRLYHASR